MWAAKLPDEGGRMYEACYALCECLKCLGVSIDGGKDSLSMAAKVGAELVKSPGQVWIQIYIYIYIYTYIYRHTTYMRGLFDGFTCIQTFKHRLL